MRGQVLLVALLSAAPGHPVLPSAPRVSTTSRALGSSPSRLAPSPYAPALAPAPFSEPDGAPRAAALVPGARQPATRGRAALLAPSPYQLELVPNPYVDPSPEPVALTVAPSIAVAVGINPRVLAPSPYEPRLPDALAPSPY